jgi:hypothetical protein
MKQLDRKNEKTALRMARATMQGGTGPVIEKIKVRGFTLEVTTYLLERVCRRMLTYADVC